MTITEAFKSGRPIRRRGKSWSYESKGWMPGQTWIFPDTYIEPNYFLSIINLTVEDITAKDWEVKRAVAKSKG